MIIIVCGGKGILADESIMSDRVREEISDMFTSAAPSYSEQDNKLEREEKLRIAQTYKRKNQNHPAYRK